MSGLRFGTRGWHLLVSLLVVVAGLAALDQRMLNNAPYYGVRPADATWVMTTGDFPQFWQELEDGDVFARIENAWPRPQGDLELAVRFVTGIRPTPTRWRIWFGERLTLSQSPAGTGCSVYPGFLLRTLAHAAHWLGNRPDDSGIMKFNGMHYAWRDDFLVFSRSRPFVQACLATGVRTPLRSGSGSEVAVHWFGPHEGYIRLLHGPGLPVEGRIKLDLTDGAPPLSLTNAWPSPPPAAALTVRNWGDLLKVASVANDGLVWFEPWAQTMSSVQAAWLHYELQPLPENWDNGATQFSIALRGIDTNGYVPIPDLALVIREESPVAGEHPFRVLFARQLSVDYEWSGVPGVYVPWLGETLSPCLGQYDRDYIATLNEPAMAALVGALSAGPADPPDVDVTLRIAWKPAAEAAQNFVAQAAAQNLWPASYRDQNQPWISPMLEALGMLGNVRINGTVLPDGWLGIDGRLFDADSSYDR